MVILDVELCVSDDDTDILVVEVVLTLNVVDGLGIELVLREVG
jgi:hypothetical protein